MCFIYGIVQKMEETIHINVYKWKKELTHESNMENV